MKYQKDVKNKKREAWQSYVYFSHGRISFIKKSKKRLPYQHPFNKKLFQVHVLPTATFNGESVVIEGQGWLIYGGSTRTTALRLPEKDSTWTSGPQLERNIADTGLCIVKVTVQLAFTLMFCGCAPVQCSKAVKRSKANTLEAYFAFFSSAKMSQRF